jgi:thymidylate kinase
MKQPDLDNLMITPVGVFLQEIFVKLNKANICYAVMRNYDLLPYSAGNSDLDILVAPADVEHAKAVLLDSIEDINGTIIGIVKTRTFFAVCIMGITCGQWWGVCVEIYSGIFFKSTVPLVDHTVLYNHIERHKNIAVIPRHIGNTIGFIKEILAHNKFRKDKPNYHASATLLIRHRTNIFNAIFYPLGDRGRIMLMRVLNSASASESVSRIKTFRISVLTRAFVRRPFFFIYKRLAHELFKFRRYFNPQGVVIAILGVDGAGKSTVINSILPILNAATHNAVFVHHLRPGLLPPLARLKGKELPVEPVVKPHGSIPSTPLISLFRLFYLGIDYILGYWIRIRPKIAKQPAIVLFDRYAYDMTLDPLRFRIGLSGRFVNRFMRFAPKPDIIICLHADPAVIHDRKQELPITEINRQVEALREFSDNEPRAVFVSTEGSIASVKDRILTVLLEFFKQRNRGAYDEQRQGNGRQFSATFLWTNESHYVAIPSKKNCRWIIPTKSKFSAKAWDLYHPYSLAGKCAKHTYKALSSLGILKFLKL